MNLGPPLDTFTYMLKTSQAVINELLWLKETTREERQQLLSGVRPKRLDMLVDIAVFMQRKNSAGYSMARALKALKERA